MNKLVIGAVIALFFSGCSSLDNYMLGQDNRPKPTPLKPITNQMKLSHIWQVNASSRTFRKTEQPQLRPAVVGPYVFSASASGIVEARSKLTGKLRWQYDAKHGLVSGPVVKEQFIAVGSDKATIDILATEDGRLLRQHQLANLLLAPPVISGDTLYAKTIDGSLYAFSLSTGQRLWRYTHGAPELILKASSAPTIAGQLVLAGFADGKLDAIDRRSGRLVWQRAIVFPQGSGEVERMVDIDATPLVENGVVYVVSYQGVVVAMTLKDGRFLWRHAVSAIKNMSLTDDKLFIVDDQSRVWAFNKHNGTVLWRQSALMHRGLSAPVAATYGLVLTDKLGFLHVLSKSTGEVLVREQLSQVEIDSAPVINENNIYVLFENGLLASLAVVV